jgi:hypothetical protein
MIYTGNVWCDSNTEHAWEFTALNGHRYGIIYSERTKKWSEAYYIHHWEK